MAMKFIAAWSMVPVMAFVGVVARRPGRAYVPALVEPAIDTPSPVQITARKPDGLWAYLFGGMYVDPKKDPYYHP